MKDTLIPQAVRQINTDKEYHYILPRTTAHIFSRVTRWPPWWRMTKLVILRSFNIQVSCFRKPHNILPVMLNCSSIILLDSNSNTVAISYMDVKLLRSYIGAALPVFTRIATVLCFRSLPQHGAAIRYFRFGAELGFLGFIL